MGFAPSPLTQDLAALVPAPPTQDLTLFIPSPRVRGEGQGEGYGIGYRCEMSNSGVQTRLISGHGPDTEK
jgi:hypothetical protein